MFKLVDVAGGYFAEVEEMLMRWGGVNATALLVKSKSMEALVLAYILMVSYFLVDTKMKTSILQVYKCTDVN